MAHFIHFVQQYSATLVDPYGRRYVARVYGACRPDDLWDGWFVFFPLGGGRAVATDRETTQGSLAAVRYDASKAHRRMREFMRKHSSERRDASQPSARAHADNRARVSRRPTL